MDEKQALLRELPAVDRLLKEPVMRALAGRCPRILLLEAAQQTIALLRQDILQGTADIENLDLSVESVARQAAKLTGTKMASSLCHVINATGTLLHTNLGRAPLSKSALRAIEDVSRSYSNLEFDLTTGKRGHRYSHIDELLCRLTGAEAAAVVNNNAGAVLLALTALAKGKEAIVSRGELVEIGGAFRVPDVMASGGVFLKEVGTTNKTHLEDYRQAISEKTALLLKVHTSNYRIVGFSSQVSAAELVNIGRQHGIPVMEDLGSGMLFDLSSFGLPREPTVSEAVAAGIDVLTFSGDKLLGGPQAGLIVGKKWVVDKIRHHPLARALRIDKLTLAALEATLRHYLDRERAIREIPVLNMLNAPSQELKNRCSVLAKSIASAIGDFAGVEVLPATSKIGGGALPLTELPGFAVALSPRAISVDELAARLRRQRPPVIGRLQEGKLLLDPRTIRSDEEDLLVRILAGVFSSE
jgi:L-seryl-tRNA(Ser) seleniumtransferase